MTNTHQFELPHHLWRIGTGDSIGTGTIRPFKIIFDDDLVQWLIDHEIESSADMPPGYGLSRLEVTLCCSDDDALLFRLRWL